MIFLEELIEESNKGKVTFCMKTAYRGSKGKEILDTEYEILSIGEILGEKAIKVRNLLNSLEMWFTETILDGYKNAGCVQYLKVKEN